LILDATCVTVFFLVYIIKLAQHPDMFINTGGTFSCDKTLLFKETYLFHKFAESISSLLSGKR